MQQACRENVWESFDALHHIELFGDQKAMHANVIMGRRMQGAVDVNKYQFHDLLPFVDEELMQFWMTIPLEKRFGRELYKEMFRRHIPAMAPLPWSHTGLNLYASKAEEEASIEQRLRRLRFQRNLKRYSLGMINPRNKDNYLHRKSWLRKNAAFHEVVSNALADVSVGGCDFFDQARVDNLFQRFMHGRDYLFRPVMQVASLLIWYELFIDKPPRSVGLSHF